MRHFSRLFASLIAIVGFVGLATPASAGFLEALFGVREPAPAVYYAPQPDATAIAAKRAAAKAAKQKAQRLAKKRLEQQKAKLAKVALAKAKAEAEAAPAVAVRKCCATAEEAIAALMTDGTLRPGDVVAGPNGMQVFVGGKNDERTPQQFVLVRNARKIDTLRARLSAYAPMDELRPRQVAPRRGETASRAAPAPEQRPRVAAAPAVTAAVEPSAAPVVVASGPAAIDAPTQLIGPPLDLRPPPEIDTRFVVDFEGKRVRLVGGYAPF